MAKSPFGSLPAGVLRADKGLTPRRPRKSKRAPTPPGVRPSSRSMPKPPPGYGAIARQQLGPIYNPLLDYYSSLIAKRQSETTSQAKYKQDVFNAFAKWYLENAPKQIQGIYSQAAGDQSAYAAGFSIGMQQAQQQLAHQANKYIQTAGGPQGQMLQPGPEAGNVIYGLGGFIPSSMLNQQGAAFGAAAALQPPAIMAEGGRQALEISKLGEEEIAQLQLEELKLRSELAAKTFELAQQYREAGQKAKADRLEALQRRAENTLPFSMSGQWVIP